MGMKTNTHPSEKSYGYKVRRHVKPGSAVVLLADVGPDSAPVLLADDVVTVMSYSNAGFQGITAHVRDASGRDFYSVPAGRLALPSS
jgi:hypothetical protein